MQLTRDGSNLKSLLAHWLTGPGSANRGVDLSVEVVDGEVTILDPETRQSWQVASLPFASVHLANSVLRADPLEVAGNHDSVAAAEFTGPAADGVLPVGRHAGQPDPTRPDGLPFGLEICRSGAGLGHAVAGPVHDPVDGCRIPLGDLNRAEIAGRLIVHSATMSPGPLAEQLASLLAVSPTLVRIQPESVIQFRMTGGRVYHQGLTLEFPDVTVRTYGSVGLDDSLKLMVETSVPLAWLPDNAVTDVIRKQKMQLPVGGTLRSPRIDLGELAQVKNQVLGNLTRNVLRSELGNRLNRLLSAEAVGWAEMQRCPKEPSSRTSDPSFASINISPHRSSIFRHRPQSGLKFDFSPAASQYGTNPTRIPPAMLLRRSLPLFCLVPFLVNSVAAAADWPRWRGPENTGWVAADVAVPATLPAKPKLLWEVKLGDGVGSPAVAEGRVFCLDNRHEKETLCAYDLADGKELWNVPIDEVITDGMGTSPRGTPVADGPRVFVQSCRGEFQCLNAADGKLLWRVNFVKDFQAIFIGEKGNAQGASRHGYTGPPLVDGRRIIVGVGGRQGASVVCFDKADGKVLWKSQDDIPGYSGPVIATLAGGGRSCRSPPTAHRARSPGRQAALADGGENVVEPARHHSRGQRRDGRRRVERRRIAGLSRLAGRRRPESRTGLGPQGSGHQFLQSGGRRPTSLRFGPEEEALLRGHQDGQGHLGKYQRGGQSGGVRFAVGDEGQSLRAGRQRPGVSRRRRSAGVSRDLVDQGLRQELVQPRLRGWQALDPRPREPAVPGTTATILTSLPPCR